MKSDIHPKHHMTEVHCTCGNVFNVLAKVPKMSVDICSACHPFYTGTQKFIDTAGRVDAFTKRYQWSGDKAKEQAKKTADKVAAPAAQGPKENLAIRLERKRLFSSKREMPVITEEEEMEATGRRPGRGGPRGPGGPGRGGPRGPRGPRPDAAKAEAPKADAPKAESAENK
jgi:large subunit ribosomal protein L31